jgi:hypothetical protein
MRLTSETFYDVSENNKKRLNKVKVMASMEFVERSDPEG